MNEVPCKECSKEMECLGTEDVGNCGGYTYYRCGNTSCPRHYWRQDNIGAVPTGLLVEVTRGHVADALNREDV